jgi:hypothetical protein
MEDFKERLAINHNALDVEWLQQPMFFYEISCELAEVRQELERAKLAFDVAEAEIAKDVRENPENYGVSKVTNDSVKEAVSSSDRRCKELKRLMRKKHEVEVLQAGVSSVEQRKRALECLVTLHGQQYFSSPKEPRDLNTEYLAETGKRRARTRKKRD